MQDNCVEMHCQDEAFEIKSTGEYSPSAEPSYTKEFFALYLAMNLIS